MQAQAETPRLDNESALEAESIQSNRSSRVGWNGLLIELTKNETKKQSLFNAHDLELWLKNCITLDNGFTLSLFSNPVLVKDIWTTRTTLALATNAGIKKSNQEATVPGFGKVYYNKDTIANIFGFSDLKTKHWITYDSDKEDTFLVHMNNKILKFECIPKGQYQYKVSKGYKADLKKEVKTSGTSNLISTVTENRKGYTLGQLERAKEARKLYRIVGTPTMDNFKSLLQMNIIKNCPVTIKHVNIADQIFGPDMSSLKGKSTQRKPKPVRNDLIEIPKELITKHQNMCINESGMVTAIDRTIKFQSLVPMDTKQHNEYYRALDKILRHYNNAGFVITTIHCNGEYQAMMEKVMDNLDVEMNFTNAQDHVPEAEQNNRTIKERIRAAYHRLPYKAIPRIMIQYLAMNQANQLDLFPVKGGVSSYYSPRMLLNQTSLDFNKHCTVPYGAYVQANHKSTPKWIPT
jgi:hypothetical protein